MNKKEKPRQPKILWECLELMYVQKTAAELKKWAGEELAAIIQEYEGTKEAFSIQTRNALKKKYVQYRDELLSPRKMSDTRINIAGAMLELAESQRQLSQAKIEIERNLELSSIEYGPAKLRELYLHKFEEFSEKEK